MGNKHINCAKAAKNDEFYTPMDVIRAELNNSTAFRGKAVYCNCDDAEHSNFAKFFMMNFNRLGLRRLVVTGKSTCDRPDVMLDVSCTRQYLKGDQTDLGPDYYRIMCDAGHVKEHAGDFLDPENLSLVDECDVVVTNPPFSLLRTYLNSVVKRAKEHMIIAPRTSLGIASVIYMFKTGFTHCGITNPTVHVACAWFTNISSHTHSFNPTVDYDPENPNYVWFDNNPALGVERIAALPHDYDGLMAVPITYLYGHNPDVFEIEGYSYSLNHNGKKKFSRVFIRRKP